MSARIAMNNMDLKLLEQYGLDKQILLDIVRTKMPFGRFQGYLICDLPEPFLLWFKQKGWPTGRLGLLLENTLEIKTIGANQILMDLKKNIKK